MATYERSTRVGAPLDEVWAFHATPRGLEALTPPWLHLDVEAVRGPDGERDPAVLAAGSVLRLSVRPFGVGPRQRWVSEIVTREERDGACYFVDEMREGPFRRWRHTHAFFGDGDGTVCRDHVAYGTALGDPLDAFGWPGFEATFRYRHRRLHDLLE